MRQFAAYALTLALAPTLSAVPMFFIGFLTPSRPMWAFAEQLVVGGLAALIGAVVFGFLGVTAGWGMVIMLAGAFFWNDLLRWGAAARTERADDERSQLRTAREWARLWGDQIGLWASGWMFLNPNSIP